ncbi:DNA-directed RNA polymerase III subunit RPC8-like [Ruditapes philippinarum]|uniref:DNA-directed RNA polymerase III subunit RPC8-like n=2 Tax=Ruditapes philippinarum TaxID=129788 RepID=UPI00295AC045|nr:DNA-directed RNA polymerase III subunit RPC8-like [Ruditapes philippinarum]XP_060573270.1 DNA-directed RNA polymerase III subunit RPC8-like [Ruditapes philippinarum]
MFVLVEMKDTVRIQPWLFKLDPNEAIINELNKKFANKVVHNVGLCIALWDIQKMEESFIFPGDGAHHTIVQFRYVVFRPFVDEILLGKIKSCSKEGVCVSMGFFDDILIPADSMQDPTRFDENEQLWAWEYQMEDGKHDLFMDIGEEIRFRVVDNTFVDTTPVGPENVSKDSDVTEHEVKKSPYTITASTSEPGLGLLSWWNS